MKLVRLIIARLREPSTMAGLGVLLAAVGINIPADIMQHVVTVVGALAGIAGIVMSEKA